MPRLPAYFCAAAGVDILLHAFVFGADLEDNAVARLRFADHSGSPLTGHAFVERRYLIIPGIRSSRIYLYRGHET